VVTGRGGDATGGPSPGPDAGGPVGPPAAPGVPAAADLPAAGRDAAERAAAAGIPAVRAEPAASHPAGDRRGQQAGADRDATTAASTCSHELILNGVCDACGAPVARVRGPRPTTPFVPLERLRRGRSE
jgi:hypothetical protein